MPRQPSTDQSLRAENAELRARLEDAEEMLRAIRAGEVDALMVEGAAGPQLFTLQGLDAEQNRFRGEMLAQISDAVIAVDAEERITFLNAAAERQYGVRAGEVLGRTLTGVFTPHWLSPEAEAGMRTALSERGEWRGELIHRRPDGSQLHVETSASALRDSDGAGTGYVASVRDITGRHQAETALRQNTALFSKIIEQAPIGTFVVDAQFRLILVNAEAMPAFVSVQPVIGRDYREVMEIIWGPELGGQIVGIFRNTLQTGERYISPPFTKTRHDLGVPETYEWELQRVTLPDGQHGMVCYFHEVTQLARSMEARRESEERLDPAVKCSQVVLFQQDVELRYTWHCNPELGLKVSNFVGKRDPDLMERAEDAAVTEGLEREVIRTGVAQRQEVLVRIHDVDRFYDLLVEPQRDAAGLISGVTCAAIDVTDRKHEQESLRVSEERYRALVMASSDVVYRMSADWSEMHQLHGRDFIVDTAAPSVNWVEEYLYPEDHPQVLAVTREAIRTKSHFEMEHRVRRVDGSVGWTFSHAIPLLDAKDEIVEWFGAASDVTVRKEAEQALADRTELLNGVLEGTTDLIFVKDQDGRVLLADAASAAVLSATPEQVVWKTTEELHPPEVAAAIRQHDKAVIAGGSPIQREETFLVAGEARVFHTLKAPLRDGSSRVVGILCISRDITERKRMEEALARERGAFPCSRGRRQQSHLDEQRAR